MFGRSVMKRCFVGLILLLVSTALAVAQPFTRRSSQMQHDGLKKTYEIANFRLGGKYDLSDPSKWENGGEGGVTLESLGGGKLRTAYIVIGTPRRNQEIFLHGECGKDPPALGHEPDAAAYGCGR